MVDTFCLGETVVSVIRKNVKTVHLSVHPPEGRVTLVAPAKTRLEVARAFAITKLHWIREQQCLILAQARETPRRYLERETHLLWGRQHLMSVVEEDAKPFVKHDHRRIVVHVRPGTSRKRREEIVLDWQRSLLHKVIPPMIRVWEGKLGVVVQAYFLQRMRSQWGSCNHAAGTIRLNSELVKKPRHLLEYVVVHEMIHILEPTHDKRFQELMDEHWPAWRESRLELNALPLGATKFPKSWML